MVPARPSNNQSNEAGHKEQMVIVGKYPVPLKLGLKERCCISSDEKGGIAWWHQTPREPTRLYYVTSSHRRCHRKHQTHQKCSQLASSLICFCSVRMFSHTPHLRYVRYMTGSAGRERAGGRSSPNQSDQCFHRSDKRFT